MSLPSKDDLTGNPTIGEYKTALGDFYDYVKGLHFWKPSTVIAVGDVVFKSYSNSSIYAKCTVAGITGTVEPVWPAVGNTIADGTVTWEMYEIAEAVTADKLKTARKIANVDFDGSTDINIPYDNLTGKPTIASVATQAQAIAGTDDATIVTPFKLRNGLNASGSAPVFACRAWVNFDGAGNILAGGNVASVTHVGTGLYRINFTTPMPDNHYACIACACRDSSEFNASNDSSEYWVRPTDASYCSFTHVDDGNNAYTDPGVVSITVFR